MEQKLIVDPAVLQTMMEDNFVLHRPSKDKETVELTLPGDMGCDYITTQSIGVMAFVLAAPETPQAPMIRQQLRDKGIHILIGLRKVYIKEPGCGAGWVVIHETNKLALRFQTEPAKEEYINLMTRIKLAGDNKPEFDDDED